MNERQRWQVMSGRGTLASFVVALSLVTGCSSGSGRGAATSQSIAEAIPPASAVDAAVQASPLTEELNRALSYAISDDEMGVVVDATQAGVMQCMQERGFDYTKIVGFQLVGDRAQHPLDITSGATYGFHFIPIDGPTNPNEAALGSQPYADALLGSDASPGCEQLASQLVATYEADYASAYETLDAQLMDAVNTAKVGSTVLEAEHSYRDCLADRGFDPDEFAAQRYAYQDAPEVSGDEIQARMIDYDCDVQTSRTSTFSQALRTAYDDFVEAHPQDVANVVAEKASYLESLRGLADDIQSGRVQVL